MGLNHQTMYLLWAICMALELVLLHVIILEQHEDVKIVCFFFPNQQMKKLTLHICTSCNYDQIKGFMQRQLVGSYFKNMFKQHIKLKFSYF
jgi:hypothetical protein